MIHEMPFIMAETGTEYLPPCLTHDNVQVGKRKEFVYQSITISLDE